MILTVSDLSVFLNIEDVENDAKLKMLLSAAYAEAEGYTGRSFDKAEYTEYFGDNGRARHSVYFPNNIPIVSVTSLTVDSTEYIEGTDFYVFNDRIEFASEQEFTSPHSLALVYEAGWDSSTFPLDLKMAILKLAVRNDMIARGNMNTDTNLITFSIKEIYRVFDRYKRNGL